MGNIVDQAKLQNFSIECMYWKLSEIGNEQILNENNIFEPLKKISGKLDLQTLFLRLNSNEEEELAHLQYTENPGNFYKCDHLCPSVQKSTLGT